ncbi:zinc ribbon domain-containing protein [Celeribacter indicus]|uniref:Regulatory protein FmdB n=1 Tax=Celeribacter indicus TaxID=1208324 RepID=A0A0B5E6S8_9RHOB|nr:zinc ribbon domain-containing protein [Celeribacter indicus]AJE48681.1 regulatory protein FmdB [Celeribacter indicus]SDX35636.1 putative regulatory protein, FmdB family [Celeribacter indicus]
MPIYTFRCEDCDAEREVMAEFAEAEALELLCFACGGTMRRAPVMTLNVIGPAIRAKNAERASEERAYFAKACGHTHACRCGVKLTRQNPFRQEIRAAHGFTDEN